MKFTFSFDKLLRHKKTLEDVARRDWAVAQEKVDAAMRELDAFYKQIDDARKRVGQLAAAGGTKGPELGHIDEFINGQKIRIEILRLKMRELMMVAEEKQSLLVEAAKEKKTLEKLKERRLDEFKLKRKKLELKEVDELVVTRFKLKED